MLWCHNLSKQQLLDLDAVEVLRSYLSSVDPPICEVNFLLPIQHGNNANLLKRSGIAFEVVNAVEPPEDAKKKLADEELAACIGTALALDADVLVVTRPEWLPYIEDVEDLGLSLTDTSFLKRYCEVFVRGNDIPWAFASPIWNQTWTGFYHMTEHATFRTGMNFLFNAQQKNMGASAQNTGQTFVYNRLPNICFTRDRLLFYELQRLKALRANWKRQEFKFEIAYYLNFYYPLLYGGFDHLALIVSQALNLGIS